MFVYSLLQFLHFLFQCSGAAVIIFCVSANVLKPSKVKSLKFSHQLQNYLANTFLSPFFLSLYPFFLKRNFLTCCLHISLFSILFVDCHYQFFSPLSLAVVSHIYHFYYFISLLPFGYKHDHK